MNDLLNGLAAHHCQRTAGRWIGRRLAAVELTVVAPCGGQIWLGDLSLLNPAGDATVDSYALHSAFTALEFAASHGSGGIGALVQPLVGERIFGTLKPKQLH